MVHPRPAVVSIFADGSVMVTTAGAELGQGMFTKVKQARRESHTATC
jgi:xanthine dehydrogenase molybdopterin-binding subunit B